MLCGAAIIASMATLIKTEICTVILANILTDAERKEHLRSGSWKEPMVTDQQAVLFQLDRIEDKSGVSGTGIVADGVVFPDGTVALRWRGDVQSTVIYADIADVVKIHGHSGSTRIKYLSQPDPLVR